MATQKIPLMALDVVRDTTTGAILTESSVPGASGNFLSCAQVAPAAGAAVAMAAVDGVKKVVIAPLVNDDGTKANEKVVYLRHDAGNTTVGIPIKPTDGLIVLYVTDLTKIFVKTIHTGDGLNVAAFDG